MVVGTKTGCAHSRESNHLAIIQYISFIQTLHLRNGNISLFQSHGEARFLAEF